MGVAFLGSYLCISILEFKSQNGDENKSNIIIYVFLYQNLNTSVSNHYEVIRFEFMYFYIRI